MQVKCERAARLPPRPQGRTRRAGPLPAGYWAPRAPAGRSTPGACAARARRRLAGRGGRAGRSRAGPGARARDADGLALQDAARAQEEAAAPADVEGVAARLWAAGT